MKKGREFEPKATVAVPGALDNLVEISEQA
jgi:hypothetical protein